MDTAVMPNPSPRSRSSPRVISITGNGEAAQSIVAGAICEEVDLSGAAN